MPETPVLLVDQFAPLLVCDLVRGMSVAVRRACSLGDKKTGRFPSLPHILNGKAILVLIIVIGGGQERG